MSLRSYFHLMGKQIAIRQATDRLWEAVVVLSDETVDELSAQIVSDIDLTALATDESSLLASAVRAETTTSPDQTNTANARGVMLHLDVTAVTALQTLSLTIQGKDPISGGYQTLATTGAIGTTATAVGLYTLMLAPGLGAIAAALTTLFGAGVPLPYTWRARIVHSGAGNFTYSLSKVLTR